MGDLAHVGTGDAGEAAFLHLHSMERTQIKYPPLAVLRNLPQDRKMMRFNSKELEESLSPRVIKRRGRSHVAGGALAALAG